MFFYEKILNMNRKLNESIYVLDYILDVIPKEGDMDGKHKEE